MVSERFKYCINTATDFIESCWDSNNPDDGLTFDERVANRINELDDDVADVVRSSMDWESE